MHKGFKLIKDPFGGKSSFEVFGSKRDLNYAFLVFF